MPGRQISRGQLHSERKHRSFDRIEVRLSTEHGLVRGDPAPSEFEQYLEHPAWEQQCLQRVGIMYEHWPRSIECHGSQIVRHGMSGRADLENETFSATGMRRRQHLDKSLDHPAVEQGER